MAQSLGTDPGSTLSDEDFLEDADKLRALDCVRSGFFSIAAEELGIEPDPVQAALLEALDGTIPRYDQNPQAFLTPVEVLCGPVGAAQDVSGISTCWQEVETRTS